MKGQPVRTCILTMGFLFDCTKASSCTLEARENANITEDRCSSPGSHDRFDLFYASRHPEFTSSNCPTRRL